MGNIMGIYVDLRIIAAFTVSTEINGNIPFIAVIPYISGISR